MMPDSESTQQNLTEHEYDGIREYDNTLPGWWGAIYVLSVLFAPVYISYYHFGGDGLSMQEEYDEHAAQVFELRFAELGVLEGDRATVFKFSRDPKWLSVGRAVFKTNCVSCHGADGQGDIGPNLTDDHWKAVIGIEDISKVIANGAANGSMPAWRDRLSHTNQVVLTAAYVASLRGTDPPGAKAPEGPEVPPWTGE